jgi:hypothetical protein
MHASIHFRYDHVNYARWVTVYLFYMRKLPPKFLHDISQGNFVAKESNSQFNQVLPDVEEDEYVHNESTNGQLLKDNQYVGKLADSLAKQGVFRNRSGTLQNIINKDLVNTTIQESLLGAASLGQDKVNSFVKDRLCSLPTSAKHVPLKAPLHRNKAFTFTSLYTNVQNAQSNKANIVKVDWNILQRLITPTGQEGKITCRKS